MKFVYYFGWTSIRILTKLVFRIKIYGKKQVPVTGGIILASNHISYYDPPVVGTWMPRQVYFMGKQELFEKKFYAWYLRQCNTIPVKRGTLDRAAIHACLKVIRDGYCMTIFPEGTRSKTEDFLEPKSGIGMIAKRGKCGIIPAYIHGFNKLKDCFFGKEKMGIIYGKEIPYEWIDAQPKGKEGYEIIAQRVMSEIRALKQEFLNK